MNCTGLPCRTRTLLIASGEDRLLPSLTEAVRLQSLLPSAQRVVLPDSGHTALLEVRQPSATGSALLKLLVPSFNFSLTEVGCCVSLAQHACAALSIPSGGLSFHCQAACSDTL